MGPPVMFAGDRKGQTHIALLVDDPLVSARAVIKKIKPTKLVVVSVSTDDQFVSFHAEAIAPAQEIDRIYRLPSWWLETTEVQHFTFSNLLGVRN